jgi:2-dehydropantoate 2-reductase
VRPRRAETLGRAGLQIRSPLGDVTIDRPPLALADQLGQPFDLVLLSCKAYDLDSAIDAFAPAVGPQTLVVPLLNGMRHLDVLDRRFGADKVTGGLCLIGSTLADDGSIRHLNRIHGLVYGGRDPRQQAAVAELDAALLDAGFDGRRSDRIGLEMWEKWVMLATLAAATTLMRAPLGAINGNADGQRFLEDLLAECRSVADGNGFVPRESAVENVLAMIREPRSGVSASMFRDIVRDGPTEGEHVIGDLIARAAGHPVPLLRLAWVGLRAYEAQRQQAAASASGPRSRG